MKKLSFWGALFILLTSISPNLSAATFDITDRPYGLGLRLFNVNTGLASISWEGTEVNFDYYNPATTAFSGTIDWEANGSPWETRAFSGNVDSAKNVTLTTVFPYIPTVWRGTFSEDLMFATGRLDGIGTSDMTGLWSLTAIDLPPAGILFIGAMGTLMVLGRKRLNAR